MERDKLWGKKERGKRKIRKESIIKTIQVFAIVIEIYEKSIIGKIR